MDNYNVVIGLNNKDEVYLNFNDRLSNSIIIGPIGSGKYSQLTKPLLNQDIMNHNTSVITIDTKNSICRDIYNLCEYHNREVVIFDPTIRHRTIKFNPINRDLEESKRIILDGLNLKEASNNDNYIFYNKLLDNSLYIIKNIYKDKANILDLYYLISNYNNKGEDLIKNFLTNNTNSNILNNDIEIVNWFINVYYRDLSQYSKSTLLRSKIEELISNELTKDSLVLDRECECELDIEYIIKNKKVLTINTGYNSIENNSLFLSNMIFSYLEIVINKSKHIDEKDNLCLYIQEPQTLLLDRLISILDNKSKVNLATTISVTSIDMLLDKYRDYRVKEYILKKCRNTFIFPGVSKNTANHYLPLLKDSKIKDINTIDEIIYMKFGQMLFIKNNEELYHKKLTIRYIERFIDEYLNENFIDYVFDK